jgi:hypothetical protein
MFSQAAADVKRRKELHPEKPIRTIDRMNPFS